MQRTRVFWPGVPTLVLVVKRTTTGPQAGVCAPFSFAQTGFGVSFPVFLLFKRLINEILFASFRYDIILTDQQELLVESEERRAAVEPQKARLLFSSVF